MPFCGDTGLPSDGPMGISVALTPSTHTVTVSKSMITNASFRTKKLPGKFDCFALKLNHIFTIRSQNDQAFRREIYRN